MGSQFAPEPHAIYDAGDAPVIFIDGMAVYSETGGTIRTVFYANQPIVEPGADPAEPCKFTRVVVLKLIYTLETQAVMRRQIAEQLRSGPSSADRMRLHA